MFIGSIEEHPLLVYLTALPFTPVNTLLYSTFMTHDIPKIVGGFNQSWPPLLHMFQAHETSVQSLVYFPDGTRIATSTYNSSIRVWDVVSGSQVIAPLAGHVTDGVVCLAVSPDSLCIVSGSADRTVRLWDTTTGAEVLPPLRGHSGRVESVAFSCDGTRIASGSNDKTIRVWDAASGCTVSVLCGQHYPIHSLAVVFTPDGRYIISNSGDHTISMWDALSGMHALRLPAGATNRIAVSPDANSIAYCSDYDTIRIRQLNASSRSHDIQIGLGIIESFAFFPDGRHIIVISINTISIWHVISGTIIWESEQAGMFRIAVSPNGEQLVIGYRDGKVALWDATLLGRDQEPQIPTRELFAMSFSPDGRQIASSYWDSASIHILDARSGIEMTPLKGHRSGVGPVAFSPCGNLIASGSNDTTVRVWNLLSDAKSLVLRGHRDEVTCITFSHDGQQIASGSWDTTVRLWNTISGAKIFPALRGHKTHIHAIAFSPYGTKIASADDECVCIWDIILGTKIFLQQVVTGKDLCCSLAFSPDGPHIHIRTLDVMLVLDTNNAGLNLTPCYLHDGCSINEPIIITADGLVVDIVARRILCKLPSIVSISTYTASTRSIAFISNGRWSSIFIMHFPPSILTSLMTWDKNAYKSVPI
jgi:WD40 repeat protein